MLSVIVADGARYGQAFPCGECGQAVIRTSSNQQFCRPCAKANRLRYDRKWKMEKAGGGEPLGRPMACETCGVSITRRSWKQHYCAPCRRESQRKIDRELYRAKQCRPVAIIGEMIACAGCATPVKRMGAGQKYCRPCEEQARSVRAREISERQRRKRGVPKVQGVKADCRLCGQEFELQRKVDAKVCGECRPDVWKLDPQKKLNLAIGNAIRASLKPGAKGRRRWQSTVGYTSDELKAHLEAQFADGMHWLNHGEWHIDHIRPLCSFSFQTPDCPQFREAWALSNLQPLWAVDNLKKGGRWAA